MTNWELKEEQEGTKITRIDTVDGVKVWLEGHRMPYKGLPTGQAILSVSIVKELAKGRLIEAAWLAYKPHLTLEQMNPFPREIQRVFPGKLGTVIAHTLEYDNAYRLRIQDLLSETSKERILQRPIREIWRLLRINKRRDIKPVHRKFMFAACVLTLIFLIPGFRRRLKISLKNCDYMALILDKSDIYWLHLRTDYNWNA